MKRLTVIGAGPGRESLLTGEALTAIRQAELVLAPSRLYEAFRHLNSNSKCVSISDLINEIQSAKVGYIAVLASGDVGFYSVSTRLKETFGDAVVFVNGLNSFQYLMAKLGLPYDSVKVVSAHGRDCSLVPYVSYYPDVFTLTGGKWKVHDILCELMACGLGNVRVSIGENLGADNERIVKGTAEELQSLSFGNLAVMLIQNDHLRLGRVQSWNWELADHNMPQETKEIMALCLAKLNITPKDVVYHIGAGNGLSTAAFARGAYESFVYAVGSQKALEKERKQYGAYNIKIIQDDLLNAIRQLPAPDKVLIEQIDDTSLPVMEACFQRNSAVRIVLTISDSNKVTKILSEANRLHAAAEQTVISISRDRVSDIKDVPFFSIVKIEKLN